MTIPPNPHPEQVEALTQVILREARDKGADSPVDYGDAEQVAKAVLAALAKPHPEQVKPELTDMIEQDELEAKALWCAREAEARHIEAAGHTASAEFTRMGRYDHHGYMPVLIDAARLALSSVQIKQAVCDLCNGRGYWETGPGVCNPNSECRPCGKCSNVIITMGGHTWSMNPAASGTSGTTKSEQPR